MKKRNLVLFIVLCLFSFIPKISAAGLTVSASSYTVYVGSTVNITANASGLTGKFYFKSNNLGVLSGGGNDWLENSSKTMSFSAVNVGSATISVVPENVAISDGSGFYTTTKSVTINVINKPVYTNTPATVTPKSSVNYLKTLEIEGKELTPKFDKETSEYSVSLESGTTEINIKATPENNKASIVGAGKHTLTEGINNIEVVVTAENGSKRTYKIKADVAEKDPIIVNIDGKKYTVVRKKEQLIEASTFYSNSTVKINNEEIPSYHGEITGYNLIGLKDEEGDINLYIYNEKKNSYKLYREFKFLSIVFYPLDVYENKIPKNYFKSTVLINETEVPCYKLNEDDEFVLLYGVNIENNNEGFYVYDPFENTLQRYNVKMFDLTNEKIEILTNIIVGLLGIVVILLITAAIQGTSNKHKKEPGLVYKPKTKEEKIKAKIDKKEAKKLKKELKKKEKSEKSKKIKKKNNKLIIEDTHAIDISQINIKK